MAIRLGGARSRDARLHRRRWRARHRATPGCSARRCASTLGFDGLVVSDYYAVSFLELQHAVAAAPAGAAARWPWPRAWTSSCPASAATARRCSPRSEAGEVTAELVDRAAARVLRQKCELGLLDPGWSPVPDRDRTRPDLDPPASRAPGPPPGRGVRGPAGQPGRRAAARRGRPGRGGRAAGRRPAGVLRLLQHAPPPGQP